MVDLAFKREIIRMQRKPLIFLSRFKFKILPKNTYFIKFYL